MNLLYHLQFALKTLRHNLRPTVLLLISLTVGLMTFMIVSSYVTYEQAYDRIFPDADNIFRLTTDVYSKGELKLSEPKCERAIGTLLAESFPEVIESGFLIGTNNPQYKIGDNSFRDEQVYHASPGFLDIFSIKLLQGNQDEVLQQPYTVLISESTARKYFGDKNPVGETILKYPGFIYRVEGIYQDIPNQAHFKADMLLSFHDKMHLPPPLLNPWGETAYYTYLKLVPGTDVRKFEIRISKIVSAYRANNLEKKNITHLYHLQSLKEIHLHSTLKNELETNAKADYLYVLLGVSLLILFAVGFNYVHFSYTKMLKNAAKTGLLRVVGADRVVLTWQSFFESAIVHLAALFLALIFSFSFAPFFQEQFAITLDFALGNKLFWVGLICILLISISVNGLIPGIIIGRYNSIELFQLKSRPSASGFSFRELFVAGQFAIIIAILVSIFSINKQVQFLKEKDKGLNIENTLVIKIPQNMRRTSNRIVNLDVFEQEVMKTPDVLGISQGNTIPGELPAFNFSVGEKGSDRTSKAAVLVTGLNYLQLFRIQLLAGDGLGNGSNKNTGCLINQSCLADLGYANPNEAIGKILNLKDESGFQNLELTVKGVCSDFNLQNMREKPGPLILFDWTENMIWGNYFVKLRGENLSSLLPFLQERFKATFPDFPFEYLVLEDFYNLQFNSETQLLKMLQALVLVAILVSAINLFALAWFASLVRTKEIGIRKVNGAKVSEILAMLNKDFVRWIVIAFVVATPVAYYAMNKWLENFAYKTSLSWWIFALAGVLALGIALLTVSWQSWKAATRNPVEALRYE